MFKLPILVVLGLVTCQVPEASRLVEGLGAAKFAAREEAAGRSWVDRSVVAGLEQLVEADILDRLMNANVEPVGGEHHASQPALPAHNEA